MVSERTWRWSARWLGLGHRVLYSYTYYPRCPLNFSARPGTGRAPAACKSLRKSRPLGRAPRCVGRGGSWIQIWLNRAERTRDEAGWRAARWYSVGAANDTTGVRTPSQAFCQRRGSIERGCMKVPIVCQGRGMKVPVVCQRRGIKESPRLWPTTGYKSPRRWPTTGYNFTLRRAAAAPCLSRSHPRHVHTPTPSTVLTLVVEVIWRPHISLAHFVSQVTWSTILRNQVT